MRLSSSRRESIAADVRARAARFEQLYGRAPSQLELAQLAGVELRRAQGEGLRAGLRAPAQRMGDKLALTLRVPLASVAPSVWHAAGGHTDAPGQALNQLGLSRAAQKAVALAQREKGTWIR